MLTTANPDVTYRDCPCKGLRPVPSPEAGPNVLVIDSDPVTAQVIAGALKQAGFPTRIAGDGRRAQELVSERHPELILLDVSLSDGNGIELCRRLHSQAGLSQIPILFISERDEIAIKMAGFDAGAVDYVTKPLTVRELTARVRTHLRLKRGYDSLVEMQVQKIQQLAAAQESFMPRPEDLPEAKFCVAFTQVLQAGGDFYDVIPIAPDVVDYIVADASGHDLSASYWTAALKSLLTENCNAVNTPVEAMHAVNGALRRILPAGVFFTMIYARLNRAAGQLQLVNAAHPPAILVRSGVAAPLVFPAEGDVVGAFADAVFETQEVAVAAGERLFLYSDGLSDGCDCACDAVGQLPRTLAQLGNLPLAEAVPKVVHKHCPSGTCEDDVLLMGIDV